MRRARSKMQVLTNLINKKCGGLRVINHTVRYSTQVLVNAIMRKIMHIISDV